MNELHIIDKGKTILDALAQLNKMAPGPLVLFVIDKVGAMVGTLTDGDIRRALISGTPLQDSVEKAMHKEFKYIAEAEENRVLKIRELKKKNIKLIPVLDSDSHIVEIINLFRCKSQLPIDAVIMAGGKGERLRPLTEKTPKPLLKVGHKAIIDYNVENLVLHGIKHISVTVNYLKEQIEEHFTEPIKGVKVETVREPKYLGTMGSVQFVQNFHNDTILVMNSDLFTNIDLEDFYLHFKKYNADMSVAAVPYSVKVPYGIFKIEDQRDITGIAEKPSYNYYANGGIYLIKRSVLEEFVPKETFFNATDLIEKLIAEKRKVIRFPISGYWIDIGNKQEYEKANDMVGHIHL